MIPQDCPLCESVVRPNNHIRRIDIFADSLSELFVESCSLHYLYSSAAFHHLKKVGHAQIVHYGSDRESESLSLLPVSRAASNNTTPPLLVNPTIPPNAF